jgi:hypothetical protein
MLGTGPQLDYGASLRDGRELEADQFCNWWSIDLSPELALNAVEHAGLRLR